MMALAAPSEAIQAPARSIYRVAPGMDVPVIAVGVLAIALPYAFATDLIHPRCPCNPAEVNSPRLAMGLGVPWLQPRESRRGDTSIPTWWSELSQGPRSARWYHSHIVAPMLISEVCLYASDKLHECA
jgi:hypothetical protein